MPITVTCPYCGKPVEWTAAAVWRPFCSQRCRLLDLGGWLDERHRIAELTDAPDAPADTDPIHH